MVTVESTTANLRELFRGPKFEPRPPADIQNNPETICRRLVAPDSSGRVRSDSILHPTKKIKAKSQLMTNSRARGTQIWNEIQVQLGQFQIPTTPVTFQW